MTLERLRVHQGSRAESKHFTIRGLKNHPPTVTSGSVVYNSRINKDRAKGPLLPDFCVLRVSFVL